MSEWRLYEKDKQDLKNQLHKEQQKVAMLKEALEFYVDKKSYTRCGTDHIWTTLIDDKVEIHEYEYVGGKKALEALEKIKGME